VRVKTYIRVARQDSGRPRVSAGTRPSDEPLKNGSGFALPTVAFAIMLDIPDALIDSAEQVIAEVKISEEQATILASVEALV
jgi:hypothetical protein